MEQTAERQSWLKLALMPHIGAETFLQLVGHFGSAAAAWQAGADAVRPLLARKQAREAWANRRGEAERAAEAALRWEEGEGCRLLMLCDGDFPSMLGEGMTPPPLLFARGNTALLHRPSVAVVGSRHATPQAERIARDFGRALSQQGIAAVSGMAAGIDTAAHLGALEGAGGTVAVWGTGIDRIYPPSNKNLAYQIAERGLIVSEFPLGTRPLAGNFPRRNRIIAALAQAVLVVEAAVESGSLITARLAAEMGREVMAVPGSIDNPHSKGCHRLIKEGAKLTESLEDILSECPQLLPNGAASSYSINRETRQDTPRQVQTASAQVRQRPSETQEKAQTADGGTGSLLDKMGYDPIHPDTLAERLGLSAADIYAALLEMELEGRVAAASGGRYQRIR
ncbi:DNA protecting protein DprA [Neisseria sp. oral taxon 020 str. F0370]|uniref:DNA-processing protein DprA n=1 Tax=unclassified Neisseria TaxID=2623750 RepID=UPI0002A397F4|nr:MULTISPECIES: DNA-processing protein DprA [unclassified Neisseria]ASP17014.1 DNA-processing protein DprA [Neisseria sp. KEM232]EKY07527.1 DNA protecting protein DprA [Neisseria sp. oral taxon 020 str. F0370]